jgi:uncharacterized repeat protein (TIGR03943 family)
MKPAPFTDRNALFAAVYLAWWLTLVCFVLNGEYRNFIRPSFVVFLWLAIAILLLFVLAEGRHLGHSKAELCDVVRGGILTLPLFALWLFYGQTLNSQAYLKRAVTMRQNAAIPIGRPITAERGNESRANSRTEPVQATILDILQRPKEFAGKWVVTEGMALRQETMRKDKSMRKEALVPGAFVLFRFSIICCVADSQPLGLLVEGADPKDLVDNNWYRVIGRFGINQDQMGTISQAVVSRLKAPPDSPYLYGSQN